MVAAAAGAGKEYPSRPVFTYTTTLARAPPSPATTSSVIAGLVRPLEHAGSAAMLIVFAFGPAPSSFTDPVTSPAVAESTVFPAGAVAAGAFSDVSSFFPPQPVIAIANTPTASEYIPSLVFLTKRFLLFAYRISLTQSKFNIFYFPAPPEPPPDGVRPMRERCSSGVNWNIYRTSSSA